GQGRVLLWVLRYTYGWHGPRTLFTWYRIAHELGMDRAAVFRAGKRLLQANVLTCTDGQLAVNSDYGQWRNPLLERETVDGAQQWITEQIALPEDSALVVGRQRKRCHGATLFRRTKDRCKE